MGVAPLAERWCLLSGARVSPSARDLRSLLGVAGVVGCYSGPPGLPAGELGRLALCCREEGKNAVTVGGKSSSAGGVGICGTCRRSATTLSGSGLGELPQALSSESARSGKLSLHAIETGENIGGYLLAGARVGALDGDDVGGILRRSVGARLAHLIDRGAKDADLLERGLGR